MKRLATAAVVTALLFAGCDRSGPNVDSGIGKELVHRCFAKGGIPKVREWDNEERTYEGCDRR